MKWGTSGLVSNQILLVSICEGSYANQSAGRGGLLALRPAFLHIIIHLSLLEEGYAP